MNKLITLFFIFFAGTTVFAQQAKEKAMEKRAREMQRVIGVDDPAEWKKFVKENYTQALIDRPMKSTIQKAEGGTESSETKSADNLEGKVTLFQRLHEDFGKCEISSLKNADDKIEMVLKSGSGMNGVITLTFDKNKPYLIDAVRMNIRN
jgi:hypothetical protein